jgi:hypothetical protein
VALSPAFARTDADVAGLWVAEFFGNKVECHLEQRGQFLFGVATVFTRAGEKNTYHLAGIVDGMHIRALHGSGNYFDGSMQGDDAASGTFFLVKSGQSFSMQAERTKRGQTVPGGLEWPPGYPPSN